MNCKISKLFFAALIAGLSAKSFAQTEEQKRAIVKDNNSEFLINFAKEKSELFEKNYALALEKAKKEGLPISGVDEKGNSFALVGFYEGTEELKYYKTNSFSHQNMMFNNNGDASSINTIKAGYLHDKNVLGQNMIAGVWDGGRIYISNLDLAGKTTIRDNGAELTSNGIFHATHVGGTVAARGIIQGGIAKGLMPEGNLYSYNWANDMSEMTSEANMGLLMSNHSYGPGMDNVISVYGVAYLGRYGDEARELDLLLNNAPRYSVVISAGNDRGYGYNSSKNGRDLLLGNAMSKNSIVVAAVNGVANYVSSNSVSAAGFSSFGPTDDFRVKPDISSKGVNVMSTGNGNNTDVKPSSGTSMASPSVTGAIGLWQQYYYSFEENYLRSSTIRALMAHTALEAGPGNGPDHMFGWGLLNVEGGAKIIEQNNESLAAIREATLTNGSVFEYEFDYSGDFPLTATLAWNDPAGRAVTSNVPDIGGATPSLVNDLDLRIVNTETNAEYFPWALTQSWTSQGSSIALQGDNARDNIEKVEAGILSAGVYKLVVSHKSTLTGGSQIFSFVLSGTGTTLSETKIDSPEEFTIYPNPVNDFLNINSSTLASLDRFTASIYDASGRMIKRVVSINEGVDVSGLSSGVYIINITDGNLNVSKKFIKK